MWPMWRQRRQLLVRQAILGLVCCVTLSRAYAAEQVLLGRGATASEGARQLLGANWLAPASNRQPPPPPDWMRPNFDDSTWTALPAVTSSRASSSSPGGLWVTPSAPTASSGNSASLAPPPPDAGPALIWPDEIPPDGGTSSGTRQNLAKPMDAGVRDAGVRDGGIALPPPCAGTLYVRRHFAVPALSAVQSLTLRIRYSDGFAAYLNGVEVVRRRLPEAALTEPSTLAAERGTVEPESHSLLLPPGLLLPEANLLAVEIHPRAAERCPRAELELIGGDGLRVVRGPYIERLLDGTLDLAVQTEQPTYLEVTYGKGEVRRARDRLLADDAASGPKTMHRMRISGLRPGGSYHYQISLRAASTGGARLQLPVVAFHAPPSALRPLRFVVYGDSRSGHAIHAQVVQAILNEDPDLVLNIGDIVERGTEDSDWDRFFAVAGPLLERLPLFLAPGNHEYARRGQGLQKLLQLWSRQFSEAAEAGEAARPRSYGSFDISGVHFVALDSNQLRTGEQLRWLSADLERAHARRPRAIVAFMHDGPYSMGWHGDNSTLIRDYVPVLERFRVSIIFSGHDHDYERGRRGRLDYIVTGGGGAELRPLKCGIPGKRRCKHPPLAFYNEHNYVFVEVLPGGLRICAKRPDGSPLEPCQLLRR